MSDNEKALVKGVEVELGLEDMRALNAGVPVLKDNLCLTPGPDVLASMRLRERLSFSDRELTPLQGWEEMGRAAKAIEYACVSGNKVSLQYAARESAFYWRELEKQRRDDAAVLIFQCPSDRFEEGMQELLDDEDEGEPPQLDAEEEALEVEQVFDRLERLEAHIRAVEASIPAVAQAQAKYEKRGDLPGLLLATAECLEALLDSGRLKCGNLGFDLLLGFEKVFKDKLTKTREARRYTPRAQEAFDLGVQYTEGSETKKKLP